MKILKIKGKDEKTVLQEIQKEYEDRAIIINQSIEKQKGFKGLFKKPQYSVTIAIEEEETIKKTQMPPLIQEEKKTSKNARRPQLRGNTKPSH